MGDEKDGPRSQAFKVFMARLLPPHGNGGDDAPSEQPISGGVGVVDAASSPWGEKLLIREYPDMDSVLRTLYKEKDIFLWATSDVRGVKNRDQLVLWPEEEARDSDWKREELNLISRIHAREIELGLRPRPDVTAVGRKGGRESDEKVVRPGRAPPLFLAAFVALWALFSFFSPNSTVQTVTTIEGGTFTAIK